MTAECAPVPFEGKLECRCGGFAVTDDDAARGRWAAHAGCFLCGDETAQLVVILPSGIEAACCDECLAHFVDRDEEAVA